MSPFASHLLSRHLEPDKSLKPRVRGRFEPVSPAPTLFTGDDHRDTPADDSSRQPVANQTDQQVSPQGVKWAHPDLPRKQSTAPEPPTPVEQASEETVPAHNNPFPARYSSFAERRTNQYNETEKTPAGPSPVPAMQGAGVAPLSNEKLKETMPEKKGQSQTPEDRFVKDNRADQPAAPFTTSGFADRHMAAAHPDFFAKTVQPAPKDDTVFSTSNPDSVGEPLRYQPSSRYFHVPEVPHPGETNQPVIKVTIGRIDVRAVVQAASSPARSTAAAKPKLSLDDYLKQRNNKTA